MPKTKTIKLRDPFAGHGGEVTEMIVREPRAIDYIELGEPVTYARGAGKDGLIVFAENDAAIKGYLERCVSADKADATLIWNMSLRDVQTVKAAVLAFFREEKPDQSDDTSTSSSQTSAGSTQTAPAS